MVILDEMEYLEVFVGATSMSMNERFTMLAATSPFRGPARRRGRRFSTNDGPLLRNNSARQSQDIINTVVHELGLDWRVQELQQSGRQSRANSQPRSRARSMSRAGSLSRHGSNDNLPGLVRATSWGNLSHHSGRSGRSFRSGQSGRSRRSSRDRDFGNSHTVSFTNAPRLDIYRRLQMRDAWMRGRRGRGQGRGGYVQRSQIARRNWFNRRGRRGRGRGNRTRYRGGAERRPWCQGLGFRNPLTPRGRAGLTGNNTRGNACGQETGRTGDSDLRGVSQYEMPDLTTLEQLDQELEQYMASAPHTLDRQLDEYMALNTLAMDLGTSAQ